MKSIKNGDRVKLIDNIDVLYHYGLEDEKERDGTYTVMFEIEKLSGFPNQRSFRLDDKDDLIYPEEVLTKIENND